MGKGEGDQCRQPMQFDGAVAAPSLKAPPAVDDAELARLASQIRAGGRYDPAAADRFFAAVPVTEGAVRVPLFELEHLAEVIRCHPDAVVAVSDVHSDLTKLQEVLTRLDVIDDAGQRTGRGELVQLGDLADGRDPQDYDTLVWGAERFDVLLCGNHEAAMLGGGSFDGQPVTAPEVTEVLRRLTSPYDLRMHAAVARHGVLFSHAGVCDSTFPGGDPERVAEAVSERWEMFLGRSAEDPALFSVPKARGGTAAFGGVFWQDWRDLVRAPNPAFRQVVGHTPLGGVEADPDGRVFAADCGGSRLGVCVLLADGQMMFGSDRT